MAANMNKMREDMRLFELIETWTQTPDKWFVRIKSLLEARQHEACSHDVFMVRTNWLKYLLSWPEKNNQAMSSVATRIQEGRKLN